MARISLFLNLIKKVIFYIILGIILIIFFYDQILGIWFAGSFFAIYFIVFLITLSSKRRLLRIIRDYLIISDEEIGNKLQRPLEEIRKIMFSLSKNQKNKKWLIAYLNKRYIFLNEHAVNFFMQLYEKGYNEKQIFESLQQKMRIRSRAEVKAIESTLVSQKRLHTSKER